MGFLVKPLVGVFSTSIWFSFLTFTLRIFLAPECFFLFSMDPYEVSRLVTNLKLSSVPNKDPPLTIEADSISIGERRIENCLVAKVFSSKAVNREAFATQISRILQATKHIEIGAVGDNLFLLDFKSLQDKKRALYGGPWNFFRDLIIRQPSGMQTPSMMSFPEISIWIQCYNLPPIFMHKDFLEKLGQHLGAVEEIDTKENGFAMGRYARVKCMLRLQNPDSLIFDPEIERTARRLRKVRREEIKAMADNRENNRQMPPEAIPIRDHFRPVINTHYSGIARGTINANNFELKPALINMVQQNQFGGATTADPHLHLRTFLEITDTVKINGVSDDIIRLRLFLFSLRDQARGWLQSLPLGSITTWQELATKFLSKYFPPAKSAQLKIEISTFRQTDFEQLYEAWERYKELLRRCPNHGFEDWVQIELFYIGLNGQTRTTVDAAAGGTIFSKSPAQAYDLLEQMTINSYQWPSERSGLQRTAGVYAVDPITSLTAQVSALTT
ncbi:uncharacterized protein [Primulina eburnea]|uniref:uncharacterized protein n=1 Tax=Primulina eburnea TaxID=1245227 RepID=UPI003C6C33D0